jgi:hypothetical protein
VLCSDELASELNTCVCASALANPCVYVGELAACSLRRLRDELNQAKPSVGGGARAAAESRRARADRESARNKLLEGKRVVEDSGVMIVCCLRGGEGKEGRKSACSE